MRKKYKRQIFSMVVAYIFLIANSTLPQYAFAAASGNYTDLLPIGAAGNTTVISNGSGWSLTTLPPTQTFGDALSRVVTTVYQSTAPATIANSTTVSTFTALGQGNVGSTTFPATWVATGRSIRVTVDGKYGTTGAPTWKWDLKLGTTTILTTGAATAVANQTGQFFRAIGLLTIGATGASGNCNAHWDIKVSSGSMGSAALDFSTSTVSAVSVDLTSQLVVNPVFTWGTQSNSNTITANNVTVEFLN
jgi:hypothetical protein